MCKLFESWSNEIKTYCIQNNLSFEKAKNLSQCWGSDFLALQYYDQNCGKEGLLNETPMPVVLTIRKAKNGKLVFEQTEHTKKYLS